METAPTLNPSQAGQSAEEPVRPAPGLIQVRRYLAYDRLMLLTYR